MTDPQIRTVIEGAIKNGQASAFRVMAKFQRVGVVYPQDDAGATKSLIEAAKRGDIQAMVLLGDAYDDGRGPQKPARAAPLVAGGRTAGVARGDREAGQFFPFDSFDKQMTLREGITAKVALYNNGPEPDRCSATWRLRSLMGTFMGGRAMDAGYAALAEAVMDGYRLAPAGLDEKKLVPLARVLPEEMKIENRNCLQREGFFDGAPEGISGPDSAPRSVPGSRREDRYLTRRCPRMAERRKAAQEKTLPRSSSTASATESSPRRRGAT